MVKHFSVIEVDAGSNPVVLVILALSAITGDSFKTYYYSI